MPPPKKHNLGHRVWISLSHPSSLPPPWRRSGKGERVSVQAGNSSLIPPAKNPSPSTVGQMFLIISFLNPLRAAAKPQLSLTNPRSEHHSPWRAQISGEHLRAATWEASSPQPASLLLKRQKRLTPGGVQPCSLRPRSHEHKMASAHHSDLVTDPLRVSAPPLCNQEASGKSTGWNLNLSAHWRLEDTSG